MAEKRVTEKRTWGTSIRNFFHSARVELGRVSWPSRQQTINAVLAIIVFSGIWAALVTVLDMGFARLLPLLMK
ncbi:preprotein translocase subunit SecE [Coprothermobacter platensis]|uniref:preprotein translocase subunit SecE n=1 Tax=Coprothermobacter platensis TaxID=108819 RepID=UPI00037978EF|nr:preprotein translocase subunit SecE [Coprothermobacter platensis]